MKKICHWILNGTGRGKRYLLLLSFIFSAITCSIIYISWNNVLNFPQAQKIISEIPKLKVQDGQLINPQDTFYKTSWSIKDAETETIKNYYFIVDTQNDEVDFQQISDNGIYLTSKNIYILNDNSLTIQNWENFPNFEIKKGALISVLKEGTIRFSLILFITLTLILFLNLYIWSFLYAILSYFITLFIPPKTLSFASRRRLSVVALIFSYIFILPFSIGNLYNSIFILFTLVLIIMSLFLTYLPKNVIISVDK